MPGGKGEGSASEKLGLSSDLCVSHKKLVCQKRKSDEKNILQDPGN